MRDTITFQPTDCKHIFTMNSYLEELETRAIQQAYAVDVDDTKENAQRLTIFYKERDLTTQKVVVAVDGKKEGETLEDGTTLAILDLILHLPKAQYVELLGKIDEVATGKKKATI